MTRRGEVLLLGDEEEEGEEEEEGDAERKMKNERRVERAHGDKD